MKAARKKPESWKARKARKQPPGKPGKPESENYYCIENQQQQKIHWPKITRNKKLIRILIILYIGVYTHKYRYDQELFAIAIYYSKLLYNGHRAEGIGHRA